MKNKNWSIFYVFVCYSSILYVARYMNMLGMSLGLVWFCVSNDMFVDKCIVLCCSFWGGFWISKLWFVSFYNMFFCECIVCTVVQVFVNECYIGVCNLQGLLRTEIKQLWKLHCIVCIILIEMINPGACIKYSFLGTCFMWFTLSFFNAKFNP